MQCKLAAQACASSFGVSGISRSLSCILMRLRVKRHVAVAFRSFVHLEEVIPDARQRAEVGLEMGCPASLCEQHPQQKVAMVGSPLTHKRFLRRAVPWRKFEAMRSNLREFGFRAHFGGPKRPESA